MRREETFTDQKYLNISFLQTYYLILTAVAQVLVEIMREHTLFRHSAHFVEVIIILRKNVSKELKIKRRKLARLMLHQTELWNVCLGNALNVDLKIT